MKRIAVSVDDSEYLILKSAAESRGLKITTFVYTVLYRGYIYPVENELKTETLDLFQTKKTKKGGGK